MKKKKNGEKICPSIVQMELYHETNVYLPTRTVYFAGSICVEDEVNSVSVAQTIKNLQILEHQDQGKPITLILNSCGGSWEDGIGLYDIIKALKSPVTIIAIGKVYSMGSIILQAGVKRIMTKHTAIMIHDGTEGVFANAKAFESWGDWSKVTRKQMYNIYYSQMKKKNPKITIKKIEDMCGHDAIFTAQEAVDIGLADELMEEVKK